MSENSKNTPKSSSSRVVSKKSKKRAAQDAEIAIAQTAGENTWQTLAGRKSGTKEFEYMDVFRVAKRTAQYAFGTKEPKPGTVCPICFCEPDTSSPWHVTWCGHGVCRDCLGQYAANHVRDREQFGPLKCPVCLKTLRKKDAVVAMMAGANTNTDLIQQYDSKLRDQVLRAIPAFRSCPKCSGGGNGGSGDGDSAKEEENEDN